MTDLEIKLLQTLSEAFGPSGREGEVRSIIRREIEGFVDKIEVDPIGNLVATVGDGHQIAILAHMDEVGFMITGICDDGRLQFQPIGGINPSSLPSKRVKIGTRGLIGVIGAKPVHLNKSEKNEIRFSDMYIDIGANCRKDAERQVNVGESAVFDTPFSSLSDASYFGKALDNRLGCFLLIRLIRKKILSNASYVFTVCEENGLRGASAFLSEKSFPYGIALDTTTPNDLPTVSGAKTVCKIGDGGVLSLCDGATVYHRKLILNLMEGIRAQGIPIQTKAKRTGGNEASAIQRSCLGCEAISLSVPCRYIHGPIGIVLEEDILNTESALEIILKQLSGH